MLVSSKSLNNKNILDIQKFQENTNKGVKVLRSKLTLRKVKTDKAMPKSSRVKTTNSSKDSLEGLIKGKSQKSKRLKNKKSKLKKNMVSLDETLGYNKKKLSEKVLNRKVVNTSNPRSTKTPSYNGPFSSQTFNLYDKIWVFKNKKIEPDGIYKQSFSKLDGYSPKNHITSEKEPIHNCFIKNLQKQSIKKQSQNHTQILPKSNATPIKKC